VLIRNDIADISCRLGRLETKVEEFDEVKTKVNDMEKSLMFVHEKLEGVAKTEEDVKSIKKTMSTHDTTLAELKHETFELREYVIDQRSRSMRDNLIFTNIPETEPEPTLEHCEHALKNFIKQHLGIESSKMSFKRVHRFGRYRDPSPGGTPRPRSMMGKFVYTRERDHVKSLSYKLKGKPYIIMEQFPEEIGNYRRDVLVPLMKDAKKKGLKSHISVDKLYINNKLQKPSIPPPYRAAEERLPADRGRVWTKPR